MTKNYEGRTGKLRNLIRFAGAALTAATFALGMTASAVANASSGPAPRPAAAPAAPAAPSHAIQVAAQPAAVSCYGGAISVSLTPGTWTPTYTTTSRCSDINLRVDSGGGVWVAACWVDHNTCQDHWTWVPQDGAYHVVASAVKDGTHFDFDTSAEQSGGTRAGHAAF